MSTANRPRRDHGWHPRVVLAVRTGAVLSVLAGAALFLATTRHVTIVDDGLARDLRTNAGTVAGALRQAGLRLGPHDRVHPDRRAAPGARVVVGRGRRIALTIDGVTSRPWLTAHTVPELLADLRLAHTDLRVTAPPGDIPRTGAGITIRTRKTVTLVTAGRKNRLTTYAGTVAELITERHLKLAATDATEPARSAPLHGVGTVSVFRVTTRRATETVTVPAPTQTRQRDDWMLDQQGTVQDGRDGQAEQQVEYQYRDGVLHQRKVLSSRDITAVVPKIVAKGSKPYPPDDTGLNWAALAQCESSGNPHSVASGGFYGLYQFNVGTWESVGGIGLPSEATPREQTYRAILLYKRSGRGQWPVCGSRL